jgi:dihydrodipicolinate synthase/N-acetylneuraminate lyase
MERNEARELARQLRDTLVLFVEADKAGIEELTSFMPSYTPPTQLQSMHFKANVILELAKEVLP